MINPFEAMANGRGAAGATAAVMTNSLVAAAPLLPGNDIGVGGPEVNFVALALNGVVTPFKMLDFFDQHKWMPLLLLVAAVTIAFLVFQDDVRKAVLNGLAAIPTAMSNYAAQKPLGIIPPGTDGAAVHYTPGGLG